MNGLLKKRVICLTVACLMALNGVSCTLVLKTETLADTETTVQKETEARPET